MTIDRRQTGRKFGTGMKPAIVNSNSRRGGTVRSLPPALRGLKKGLIKKSLKAPKRPSQMGSGLGNKNRGRGVPKS